MTIQKTSRLSHIWQLFKLSFKEEQQDYTQGSINKAIFLLSIPMVLEMSLEGVFALVDIFFVGKISTNAVATVGLTESVITIVYSVAIGLSTAATAIVSRRIGEKDPESAARAGAQAILLSMFCTLIISVLGVIYAPDILAFMGAKPEVVRDGAIFTRIMLGSSFVIMMLFLINGIFRGAGDAAMAMRSLWLASAINIILCPIMIHYYGLMGAAIATVIGRGSGVLYQCYHLTKGNGILKFKKSYFNFDLTLAKQIYDLAYPATVQFIISSGSWILMAKLVADTGSTEASAGYQIAIRNIVFFILPAWGLSNAAATLVGQNLGAKQPERAAQSVIICTKANAIFMGLVACVFVFCATPIITFFTHEPEVIKHGVLSLRIIGAGFVFYGMSMVLIQSLNGAGDTRTPTMISFVCFWLIQVPLGYFLALYCGWNEVGAFCAVPIAETVLALVALYYFRKGKWKTMEV